MCTLQIAGEKIFDENVSGLSLVLPSNMPVAGGLEWDSLPVQEMPA
jgi:hypothetical protein